jgi:hypothetical protein
MNRFIDHLYTRLGTTSTYNAVADLHTLQISRAHAKSSQSAFTSRFLVTDLNNGDYSAFCARAVARWLILLTTELST